MVSMNCWQSPPTLLLQCSCRYDDDTTVKNCNDRTDCSASAFAGALRVVDNQHSEASATAFTRCQQRAHPHTSIMCALRASPNSGLTHHLPPFTLRIRSFSTSTIA